MIAIGNSADPSLVSVAEERLDDPSPLVRGAAVWALSRLLTPEAFAKAAAAYRSRETDEAVIEEWDAARELGLAR